MAVPNRKQRPQPLTHAHLVAHLSCPRPPELLYPSVPLHPQLQAVKQVEVVQPPEGEVVWPLLAVGAQHKQAAVGLVAEKLQGRLAARLKGLHTGVLAAESVCVKL